MKFLIDQNLSPLVATGLSEAGHDAIHVSGLGMERADDSAVLDRASAEGRVIVSADIDFGTLLAVSGADRPSVVLIRRSADRRAIRLVELLLANLADVEEALGEGAIVALDANRIRIRALPLR